MTTQLWRLWLGAMLALGLFGTHARAQTATLTADTATYDPAGGTINLTSTLTYTGLTPSAYAFSVQLPAGWTFVSQGLGTGLTASASPASGDNLLEWAFSGFPAHQTSWTFAVQYPAGQSGTPAVSVPTAQYRSPVTNLSVASITFTQAVPRAPSITTQPSGRTVTAGESVTFSVGASGNSPLSYQWAKNGTAIAGATGSTYTIGSAQSGDAGNYTVTVSNGVGSTTSNAAALVVNQPPPEPRITGHPDSQTVNAGAPLTLRVFTTGAAPLSFQWKKDNIAIVGATSSTYTITSAQPRDAGTYTVTVWNSAGTVTSNSAVVKVNGGSTSSAQFVNIATRAYCSSGDRVAIGGFVINGNAAKRVLMRAVGPTLATLGLKESDVLQDPLIELHRGVPTIAQNDDWGTNADAADITNTAIRIGATALAGSDTKSAAMLLTLNPGVYTFIVKGKNESSGIVLLEVYDAD